MPRKREIDVVETEYDCPRGCDNKLDYGKYIDADRGIRGYTCSECNYGWNSGQLQRMGVKED